MIAQPTRLARRTAGRTLSSAGSETLSYAIQLDDALSRVAVELCPTGFRIEGLSAPSPGAQALLAGGKIVTPEGNVPCPGEALELPRTKPGECLRYTVDLPEKTPDPTSFRRAGEDRLASPDLWLWVPSPRPVGQGLQAHFALPSGVSAALPWPELAGGAAGTDFIIPETAFAWKAAGAFSHAALAPLFVPGGELRLALLGDGFAEHQADVRDWIAEGARATSALFGHFPVSHALVIGVPGDRTGPAFGMALRGGGAAVVILLDRHASAASLANDWTACHEFLHLAVPRLPPEDAWLFEGLATYYTEVMRARAGLISPARAYQNLLDGFERGRVGAGAHTLRDDSSEMRARHAFYRVYWSGAAIAFLTDVAARRAHGSTLDSALSAFADCCAASDGDWTADRVLARLDASLGTPRFSSIANDWLDRRDFPSSEAALRGLGVARGSHGEAVLTPAADAAIRDAIMAHGSQASHPKAEREPHQGQ